MTGKRKSARTQPPSKPTGSFRTSEAPQGFQLRLSSGVFLVWLGNRCRQGVTNLERTSTDEVSMRAEIGNSPTPAQEVYLTALPFCE